MIALDPRTTALVLIDLQNGIFGRKLAPISAEELLAQGRALAEKFRVAAASVVLVNATPKLDGPVRQVDEPVGLQVPDGLGQEETLTMIRDLAAGLPAGQAAAVEA